MTCFRLASAIIAVALCWSHPAQSAFRTCHSEVNESYAAHTQYIVGELDFNGVTGEASGTETIYNHSNRHSEGFSQCHVTYELQGSYEPISGTFVMDATRSNHSAICPAELIAARYPQRKGYFLQLQQAADGTARVHLATSGEFMADADLHTGRAAYRTDEKCTAF